MEPRMQCILWRGGREMGFSNICFGPVMKSLGNHQSEQTQRGQATKATISLLKNCWESKDRHYATNSEKSIAGAEWVSAPIEM